MKLDLLLKIQLFRGSIVKINQTKDNCTYNMIYEQKWILANHENNKENFHSNDEKLSSQ